MSYIVKVERTQNKFINKFEINKFITNHLSFEYNNIDDAKNSQLAQELFYLPFVKKVYITPSFISIERFNIVEWEDVEEEVKNLIENYLNSGKEVISEVKKEKNNPCLYISKNFVSITKYDLKNWNEVTLELRNFIKNYLEINEINFKRKEVETEEIDLDETSKKIISILDEYIKPAVSSDGGNILFDSYDKDKKLVKVILQGACSGCPSSTVTLKNGIENMLKEMLSDKVNSVEAING